MSAESGHPSFLFSNAKVLYKSNMPFMPIYAKFIRHIGIKKGNPPSVEDCLDCQVFIAKRDVSAATPRYFLAYEFGISLWCALDAQGTILGQETVACTAVGQRGHQVLLLPPGIASGKGHIHAVAPLGVYLHA